MLKNILAAYNIVECTVQPFGEGLINNTWKVVAGNKEYILQRVNEKIFTHPEKIAGNIKLISQYLNIHNPGYLFVAPLETISHTQMLKPNDDGYFRVFPFVKKSCTLTVISNSKQAFEAAKQFALFTKLLAGINIDELQITLPDFHNLSLRYSQFEEALQKGNAERIAASKEVIEFLQQQKNIVDDFENIKLNAAFKLRVTHHDTKISNVLFDKNDNGLCVIDLDTVMPGYFFSDLGDMMRTYLSPVSEEENDFSKIDIRDEIFEAVVKGYLSEMKNELSDEEKNSFVFAGKFMIYMQALRFITDYLNNDIYYGAKYQLHNYNRAENQCTLLKILLQKEKIFNKKMQQIFAALS